MIAFTSDKHEGPFIGEKEERVESCKRPNPSPRVSVDKTSDGEFTTLGGVHSQIIQDPC